MELSSRACGGNGPRVCSQPRGPVQRLGMATMTRARGGLAAEMKALANNLQRRRVGGSRGPVLTFRAGQVTQCGTRHLQGSSCRRRQPRGNGEGVAPAGTQRPLSGATGREEEEGAQGRSVAGCSMHSGGTRRRMGGAGALGCAGGHAPHPSVPLPGHHRGVGVCRQVPASPLLPASEDTSPMSLAAARIGASPGCATGKEGTGDRPWHSVILSHPPAAPLPGGVGRGAGLT